MAYYNNLSMVFVDGIAQQHYNDDEFYVAIENEVRKGASYKIRTLVPRCLTDILDPITTVDTTTRKNVIKYLNSVEEPSIEVTPITRSYHIYSTFIQTVTEQVIRGKLKVKPGWSDSMVKTKVAPYIDMMEFDIGFSKLNQHTSDPYEFIKPPTSGLDFRFVDVLPSYRLERVEDSDISITDRYPVLLVNNSSVIPLNTNYVCVNQGANYMKSVKPGCINEQTARRWVASNGSYIEYRNGYWGIYTVKDECFYRAEDRMGNDKIWTLDWKPVYRETRDHAMRMTPVYVQIDTSNEYPIHRLSFTRSRDEYEFLMRVAKLYLKEDLTKDGMNI